MEYNNCRNVSSLEPKTGVVFLAMQNQFMCRRIRYLLIQRPR